MTGPLQFLEESIRTQGDVVRFENAYGPVCFFNHPDHVQAVLLSNNFVRVSLLATTLGDGILVTDGDLWRRQRRLIQPTFQDQRLRAFGTVAIDMTRALFDRWDEAATTGSAFDIAANMRRLTLEIIVKALFSIDLGENAESLDEAYTTVLDELGTLSHTQFNVPVRFTPGRNASLRRAMQTVDRHVHEMIADRRSLEDKPRDLLSLLVTSDDEATGAPLTDRQVRDQILTMLLAGHETTAIALGWAWYAIAGHPEIEARLLSELQRELGDRLPGVDDVPRLTYARTVLDETMRLYPPVCFMTRQTVADDEVGGHRVPAKTAVLLSAWTTHRHKDFWDDPERFDPERFTPERSRGRHRYAYFPFAGGRHLCLGQSFAMLEGQLILAMLLQRYRIHPVSHAVVEPNPLITLRQKHGYPVIVERRAGSGRFTN